MRSLIVAAVAAAALWGAKACAVEDPSVWFQLDGGWEAGRLVSFSAGEWRIKLGAEEKTISQERVLRVGFGGRPEWYDPKPPAPPEEKMESAAETPQTPPTATPPEEPRERVRNPGRPFVGEGRLRKPEREIEKDDPAEEQKVRETIEEIKKRARTPEAVKEAIRDHLARQEKAIQTTKDPKDAVLRVARLYISFRVLEIDPEEVQRRMESMILGIEDPEVRNVVIERVRRSKVRHAIMGRPGPGGPPPGAGLPPGEEK